MYTVLSFFPLWTVVYLHSRKHCAFNFCTWTHRGFSLFILLYTAPVFQRLWINFLLFICSCLAEHLSYFNHLYLKILLIILKHVVPFIYINSSDTSLANMNTKNILDWPQIVVLTQVNQDHKRKEPWCVCRMKVIYKTQCFLTDSGYFFILV